MYGDWRGENVLLAPAGLSSKVSPLTKRKYKYRIIDLETANTSSFKPAILDSFNKPQIEDMVERDIEQIAFEI